MNHDYRALSNDALNEKLGATVREERRLTIEVLHLLREVEKRELFARMGFSSLFVYCVEHLKYSESAAQRRIVAMRALRSLPELEEKIESGKLSLSVLALAESTLRQNAKAENRKVHDNERRAVLQEMEGLSRRKAEERLVQKFELSVPKSESKEQPLADGGTRIVLEFTEDEMREIEELRRLSSRPQTAKEMTLSLVRAETAKRKRQLGEAPPLRKPATDSKRTADQTLPRQLEKFARSTTTLACSTSELPRSTEVSSLSAPTQSLSADTNAAGGGIKLGSERSAIPTSVKREVWARAKGQCEHRSSQGSRCSAQSTLEFDHINARAFGGSDNPENLRILCRAHHRLVTTKTFGTATMKRFRPTLR